MQSVGLDSTAIGGYPCLVAGLPLRLEPLGSVTGFRCVPPPVGPCCSGRFAFVVDGGSRASESCRMEKVKLDSRPARTDMTSREAAKVLGGLIGAMLQMSDNPEAIRDAVRWIAENDEYWEMTLACARAITTASKLGVPPAGG
jgi:hypothetical protein